jgi:hypothetical protein
VFTPHRIGRRGRKSNLSISVFSLLYALLHWANLAEALTPYSLQNKHELIGQHPNQIMLRRFDDAHFHDIADIEFIAVLDVNKPIDFGRIRP